MRDRKVPEFIFGLNAVPFGVIFAYIGSVMPFVLRQKGVDVGRISEIAALAGLPSTLQFLWTPVVDIGLRRRTWLILLNILGAACMFVALNLAIPQQLNLYVILLVLGAGLVGLTSSCNGGLLAMAISKERIGRASAWLNIGNLVAGALGAYIILLLVGNGGALVDMKFLHPSLYFEWNHKPISPFGLSLLMVVMLTLPSLAALWIPEPKKERQPAKHVFRGMVHDVWATIKSRPGWTGIVICLSPVGSAVMGNLFSGIAVDYHAPDTMVSYINGLANALLTAFGCYIGGLVCDRMNRRLAYCLAGGLTAVSAIAMMLAPLTPATYAVGACSYLLITGFCYSAFYAFVLEIVGSQEGSAASTRYSLFTAASNGAIMYVTFLDGKGYSLFKDHAGWWNGPRGMLATDALANLAGIVLLLALISLLRRGGAQDASAA
jgi:MFS transporter, PAT family, beta-lactamase induction signal transducer AmpG